MLTCLRIHIDDRMYDRQRKSVYTHHYIHPSVCVLFAFQIIHGGIFSLDKIWKISEAGQGRVGKRFQKCFFLMLFKRTIFT